MFLFYFHFLTAWATKRGFITHKAARTDVYRSANNILRLTVESRLCMCMRPPGYTSKKGKWKKKKKKSWTSHDHYDFWSIAAFNSLKITKTFQKYLETFAQEMYLDYDRIKQYTYFGTFFEIWRSTTGRVKKYVLYSRI